MKSGQQGLEFACFGNYGARVYCQGCRNQLSCKTFTNENRLSAHIRYKGKHKGRGRWTRKDAY